MNFDTEGRWDDQGLVGCAVHAPPNIKAIVVDPYYIVWLDMLAPDRNFYAKNYIVTTGPPRPSPNPVDQ